LARKPLTAEQKEKARIRKAAWHAANREHRLAVMKRWAQANPDKVLEAKRAGYERRKDSEKEKNRARYVRTQENNPGHLAAKCAARRRSVKQATPLWGNPVKIAEFYRAADLLGMYTGDWYEVDHIVPLDGKTVCGLHVENNLQVLPRAENRKKGNRVWPGKP
jgi:hypothetical protein